MARVYHRTISRIPAEPPGTIQYQGARKAEQVSITLFDFKDGSCQERTITDIRDCLPYRDTDTVTWINIDGLHDTEALKVLNDHFGIHLLVQEDIVNTYQRPKVEDFGDYLFIVMHMLSSPGNGFHIQSEQALSSLMQLYGGTSWPRKFMDLAFHGESSQGLLGPLWLLAPLALLALRRPAGRVLLCAGALLAAEERQPEGQGEDQNLDGDGAVAAGVRTAAIRNLCGGEQQRGDQHRGL